MYVGIVICLSRNGEWRRGVCDFELNDKGFIMDYDHLQNLLFLNNSGNFTCRYLNIYLFMKKELSYEKPETILVELKSEGAIMSWSSTEVLKENEGSWGW